jgi:integrase
MSNRMASIAQFESWLRRHGRSEGTIDQYVRHVRTMMPRDETARLIDRELSPKYRGLIRAALLSWANFTNDEALRTEIRLVKMPSLRRQKSESPLSIEIWKKLRTEIDRAGYIAPEVRTPLSMIAWRGFRVGDVLRLERDQVTSGLRTGLLVYQAKGSRRLEFTVLSTFRPRLEELAATRGWACVRDLVSPDAEKDRDAAARKRLTVALRSAAGEISLGKLAVTDLHLHLLRRTYAHAFYHACGKDLVQLQEHMGWAELSTAAGYVEHSQRSALDAIALKMLDD